MKGKFLEKHPSQKQLAPLGRVHAPSKIVTPPRAYKHAVQEMKSSLYKLSMVDGVAVLGGGNNNSRNKDESLIILILMIMPIR